MGTDSKIAWTHHTFNPWIGCHKIAPECANCYAAELAGRYGWAEWGANGTRRVKAESGWRVPHKWNRDAEAAGERRRVFCASLADVFEDWNGKIVGANGIEVVHDFAHDRYVERDPDDCGRSVAVNAWHVRARLFALIDATPWLDWLLLTKRPENARQMWSAKTTSETASEHETFYRSNVWLGTTAGTQPSAEKNIPELLKLRNLSPVLFVSAEPLLEPVDFSKWLPRPTTYSEWSRGGGPNECEHGIAAGLDCPTCGGLDWVIGGLESGDDRRDPGVEPLVELARRCQAARVPFFCKQDCARKPGRQGRIPADVWKLKQFPEPRKVTA